MNARNIVGACLEMSQAEAHPHPAHKQLFGSGEKNKLIGASRIIPKPIVRGLLQRLQHDTLPLSSNPSLPFNYGCEAAVFGLPTPDHLPERVLKLYHITFDAVEVVREYSSYQAQMMEYFPSFVVPASLFVYEGRFAPEPCVAAIQKKVDGCCLFANRQANQDDLVELHAGVERMVTETGLLPDFSGERNVLVDGSGNIRIVDCGLTIPEDMIDRSPNLRPNLEWLAMTAGALTELDATAQSA